MVAGPLGFRVTAVDGLRPIEVRRTAWDGPVIHVKNVAGLVGVHGVEQWNRHTRHRFLKLGERFRFAHFIPFGDLSALFEAGEFDGELFAVTFANDGAVVRLLQVKYARSLILNPDGHVPGLGLAIGVAVFVGERVARLVEGFLPNVDDVRVVHGVAPTKEVVVADGRKSRTKKAGPRHVPTLIAVDVAFVPLTRTEERLVRIDQQHSVAAGGFRRGDGPHVGPLRGGGDLQ